MLKMNILSRNKSTIEFFSRLPFFFAGIVIAALVGGIACGLMLGGVFGHIGYYIVLGSIGVSVMAVILMLGLDELAANSILVVSLCVDWYLGYFIIAIVLAALLLFIFFFTRSPYRPWIEPRALWLWILFLGITIYPAIHGAITSYDVSYYYPNLILGALLMFWLGTLIARDLTNIRRFFQILAIFAALIAIHIILEAATGHYLLPTASVETFLASRADYQLGTSGISRLASFFIQPDAGGAFLAPMIFIPLGLFVESSSFWKKASYLVGVILILIALLLTYSAGAGVAACVGFVVFFVLVGSTSHRIQLLLFIGAGAAILLFGFPTQVTLLLQHASNPNEWSLRNGLWQTAWQVIRAFPLTGIGLGRLAYLVRSGPYNAPTAIPENNPHNSYLEIGAMAGLPTLFIFLALLTFALWAALCHWRQGDGRRRSLLGAGIAAIIVLSLNSWSFGVWTLPPLAACGWMMLGVISSPLLSRGITGQMAQKD
jgi:O-antigen ligase